MNELANVTTNNYMPTVKAIVELADGTFKKEMEYHEYSTFRPETTEEKLILFKVFNEPDTAIPMKQCIGKEYAMQNFKFTPYDSVDESTGEHISGVTTVIQTTNGEFIATSSKSVYYSIIRICQSFGTPLTEGYKPPIIKVFKKKINGNDAINIELIGFAE